MALPEKPFHCTEGNVVFVNICNVFIILNAFLTSIPILYLIPDGLENKSAKVFNKAIHRYLSSLEWFESTIK